MFHNTVMANAGAFRLEREMLASARRWLSQRGLEAKGEFALPWGICDLVGISFYKSRVHERLKLGQKKPIGSPRRIDLLTRIPDATTGRAVSISTLKKQVQEFADGADVEAEIAALIRSKFVIHKTASMVQKLNGWMPLSKRFVTIELKLDRVSEALSQARAHRYVADEAYIGLPLELAERVARGARRSLIAASGVGVLGVGRRECRVLLPSTKPDEQHSVLKIHCVERLWQTSIRGK
jgi:hypothetical protein